MSPRTDRQTLRDELAACHAQAKRLDEPGFPDQVLGQLQRFQRRRLSETYADLAAQDRYAPAVDFFLEELYGGANFRERDRQLEQVLPVMTAMLPAKMRGALADAFRLQAMSLELDIELALALAQSGRSSVTPEHYLAVYTGIERTRRQQQIDLIHRLAVELDVMVRSRMTFALIAAMRGPAKAAGFGALQAFLERGVRAFRRMGGSGAFAEAVKSRELALMERLYAGHENPFGT